MGMLDSLDRQMSDETQLLLRFRLTVVAAVFAFGCTLFAVRNLFFAEIERSFLPQQLAVLTGFLLIAYLIRRNQNLSLDSLRKLELLIFGVMVLHLFHYFFYWIVQRPESFGSAGIYRAALSFFAIMVVYGMFIPNHWPRALVVVSLIGAMPGLIAFLLWLGHSEVRQNLLEGFSLPDITYTGLMLFLGAVVSAFGSHIVHSMREGSARMREMGMYQLRERLGQGGMGEVWKAEHELLARPAAIKMIRPDTEDSNGDQPKTLLPRFEREAQITASLRSPHTVELYDFGVTSNGMLYYVMEYLDGMDLETLVERFGPLPAPRVVYLLQQVAESLAEAHGSGLVHRDIKPSNIYLTQLGVRSDFVKVLDFGLVKSQSQSLNGQTQLTMEGTTTGTPAFMAPELALGKNEVDARTDIYALGCVAYWLLTGMFVFEGETPMEIVVNHVKTPPLPPSKRTELKIPSSLEKVVMACLSKDPKDRPQNVEELSRMLSECHLESPWTQVQASRWWHSHLPQQATH
jgi:hypothetical protein